MNLKEYIEFYENEIEKLEEHKIGLLELDKSTAYTDKKIDHINGLVSILRNCKQSETLRILNNEYKRMIYTIEVRLQHIDKAKQTNNSEEETNCIFELLEYLEKVVEEENQ